jgi:Spy/CpxP family protein refolding chaperone
MNEASRAPVRGRRVWLGAGVLALFALGAAALAAAPPGVLAHARHGFAHFRHHHGHGPHAWSEDEIRSGVRFVLGEADASDEQIAAVTAIASGAAAELRELHDAHRARREAFAAALVAADRDALDTLRSEELATLASASERLVAALVDAAEVLSPEQRQRLADAHAAHHHEAE